MSMLKHLIFSDLDGTLLDHYTYQSDAASKTLEQLKDIDIPVILNTSKTFAELTTLHRELKLTTPFIVENGAAIYMPIGTFSKQPEDTEIVGDYWVKSFCLPVQHWLTLLSPENNRFCDHYHGFSSMSDAELSTLTGLSIDDANRAKQREYGEPIQWLADDSLKQIFVDYMMDLGANVVQGGRFLHIGGYCDKGQALLWLTKHYQEHYQNTMSSPAEPASICTIALGDGENDIAMLEAADIAVQIKSPVHEFPQLYRQKMTTQTTKNGPEGWAEAIETILAKQLSSHNEGVLAK